MVTWKRFHERSGDLPKDPSDDEGEGEEAAISDPRGTTADSRNDGPARVACARRAAWRKARSCPHRSSSSSSSEIELGFHERELVQVRALMRGVRNWIWLGRRRKRLAERTKRKKERKRWRKFGNYAWLDLFTLLCGDVSYHISLGASEQYR